MKNFSLSVFLLFFSLFIKAQSNGSVKGTLLDTAAKLSLSEATISVLFASDSSLVNYTMADKKGFFEIRNLEYKNYFLIISFAGYENLNKSFSISADKKNIDLGVLAMQKDYKTLTGVVVTDAAPVKMNGDTISFKVDAFKAKPNATVEDVLKKLPGMQVQKDGTVTAMGETVQKVYVDGKDFFGNDPKMATKNITADMVDQIQVFDDMSEQAKFTKIDDGSRSKTLNIKLKKDRNRGDFGKITAGGGTDNRYESNLSFNHFRGSQRFSLIGSANNTNKQSFTFNDFSSGQSGISQLGQSGGSGFFTGGGMNFSALNGGGGGSNGVSTPKSIGLNYNDLWGKKIDFRSSYNFSQNDFRVTQNKFRSNSFPGDSSSDVSTTNESKNRSITHRVSMRWEYTIDSINSILYSANLNAQNSNGQYSDTSFTYSRAIKEFLAIAGRTNRIDDRDAMNYNGELLYRRKFIKRGRTFTLGWRNGYSENGSESNNKSPISTYNADGSIRYVLDLDQQDDQDANTKSNTLSTSYTEPIGKNKLIEFNYAYSGNDNTSDRKNYEFNSSSGKYDKINLQQTNYFEYINNSNRAGANFRVSEKKYNYQLGMAVQLSELNNRSIRALTGKDTTIKQRFTNLFPSANFGYTISRTKNIKIFYRGRTNAPTVSQLQDVPDVSNPFQVKTGNPSLKQEFTNNLNMNYSTFNILNFRFFNANLSINTTANKIVNSIDSLTSTVLITKPENLNGAFSSTGFFALGFPIKKLKGSNLNFTTIGFFNRDVSLFYKKKTHTDILTITQILGFNYSKNKFDFGLTGSIVYNKASYALQAGSNTEYFRQTYSADFSYRFKKDYYFLTDVDYFVNTGRTQGYNQNMMLWNMAVAKKFLKNKAAEVKLTAYDVLNQNTGITRNIGDNYFEDVRANVVPRFFLLTLTFNINRMGGNPQGPPQIQKMLERGIKVFQ